MTLIRGGHERLDVVIEVSGVQGPMCKPMIGRGQIMGDRGEMMGGRGLLVGGRRIRRGMVIGGRRMVVRWRGPGEGWRGSVVVGWRMVGPGPRRGH